MAKLKSTNSNSSNSAKPTTKLEDSPYQVIALDLIDDPEAPMRSDLTPASVEDLVMSIKQVGIIEPIIVKPNKGRFEVIAGHRRTFAARIAKLVDVPCYIRNASADETEMLKIHENLYRADIKPADEAKHFEYLIKKRNMSPSQIAQLIGKSLSYVTDRIDILSYPPFLLEAMNNGEISFSVAREFIKFDDDKQMMQAVYFAKRGGMTQEMARKWVNDHKRAKETPQILAAPNAAGMPESAPVEHYTECIFCRAQLRLIEAQVVYMHRQCAQEALRITAEVPADSSPQN